MSTDEVRRLTAPDESRSVSYEAVSLETPWDVSEQRHPRTPKASTRRATCST